MTRVLYLGEKQAQLNSRMVHFTMGRLTMRHNCNMVMDLSPSPTSQSMLVSGDKAKLKAKEDATMQTALSTKAVSVMVKQTATAPAHS